jgi:hypothetical protein
VPVAPAASYAKVKSIRVSHHRYCRIIRLSPRDGLTAYSMFSPETGFIVSVAGAMRSIVAGLTPASGRQDRMALPYATVSFVFSTLSRPSHPAPNVCDDRETPLMWARDGADSAGDLGRRSTAAHWHDGQITCRAVTLCQGHPVIPGCERNERTRKSIHRNRVRLRFVGL